jgi:hypothetical protein
MSYRLWGDDLSELSANCQPPADKTDTDQTDNTAVRWLLAVQGGVVCSGGAGGDSGGQ